MPKLSCPCGHVVNLSPIPSPDGLLLYSEHALDEIREQVAALVAHPPVGADLADECMKLFELRHDTLQAYECAQCGRVAVFGVQHSDDVSTWLRPSRPTDPRLVELVARRSRT